MPAIPFLRAKAAADRPIGIIDIGFRTCDCTIADKTRYSERGSQTTESGIAKAEMIFMGDAVYPGGNDYSVPDKAGVDTIAVGSIDETRRAIEAIIYCLG